MGHAAKLDRAREHLERFRVESTEWVGAPSGDPPFGLIAEPPVYRIIYTGKPFPSERFGVLIGDVVQNLRQSLDHLAYELAEGHTPQLTDAQRANSEFPVFGERPPTTDEIQRRIGGCCSCAKVAIAELQPHRLGYPGYVTSPLWKLHELGRIDKHRVLLPTVLKNTEGNIAGPKDYVWSFSSYPQLEAGSEVARITVLDPGERPPSRIDFQVDVVFGDGPAARESVNLVLTQAIDEAAVIVCKLEPLLLPHDHIPPVPWP